MAIRSIEQRIRRFFKSSTWQNVEIGIYIITMLVLFPVIIPIALTIDYFESHQKQQAAARFPCTNCGKLLGATSIKLADTEQYEFMQRLMRENSGRRIRPATRTVYAICSNCGTKFTYLNKARLFKIDNKNLMN
jgi:predicted RNA-binding Zn-ribbon protein involved in translation (DUF1610 family)